MPLLQLPERRRVFQTQLYVERHPYQDDAEQERYAPAPGGERSFSENGGEYEEAQVAQYEPDGNTYLREAAVETTLAFGCVLRGEEHSASPLAAYRETLQKAQHEQE